MKVELEFAELHNPLFLSGTNLQLKLMPDGVKHGRAGLHIHYDRAEKELIVEFNGKTAIVPATNVSSMTIKEKPAEVMRAPIMKPAQVLATTPVQDQKASVVSAQITESRVGKLKQPSAQVSGPSMHVFAEAPGKVRD